MPCVMPRGRSSGQDYIRLSLHQDREPRGQRRSPCVPGRFVCGQACSSLARGRRRFSTTCSPLLAPYRRCRQPRPGQAARTTLLRLHCPPTPLRYAIPRNQTHGSIQPNFSPRLPHQPREAKRRESLWRWSPHCPEKISYTLVPILDEIGVLRSCKNGRSFRSREPNRKNLDVSAIHLTRERGHPFFIHPWSHARG